MLPNVVHRQSLMPIELPPVGFLRERKRALVVAVIIVGAVPIKEVAFGLAIAWLVIFRPLSTVEVKGVLIRLWPILLMLFITVFMTFIDVTDSYDRRGIVRILFYYIRIPVFLSLGFGARKYMFKSTSLMWMLLVLGLYSSSLTIYTYLTSDVAGLDRTSLRQVVGGGDPVAAFLPIITWILWSKYQTGWLRIVLICGVLLSLFSVVLTQSRTGLVSVVLSLILILPRMHPIIWVRWGVLAVLGIGFVLTTPVFPIILRLISIDPAHVSGLNEIIARPRYDFSLINQQWRGYETYRAFLSAKQDGIVPLFFGHGLSALANLGIYIELAPGQFFNKIDIFHNGYSFLVLHSGIFGIGLYAVQLWVLARPRAAFEPANMHRRGGIVNDDKLYALVLLSLAVSTSVIAGMFNASTFASLHLFLIGCFYPLRGSAFLRQRSVDRKPLGRRMAV